MASKPHKHILTSVPPVGFVLDSGGRSFVVEASRAHTARDGRATAVIDWRGACMVCGCDIRQQTGMLIRYFNKRCSAHSRWNAERVTTETTFAKGTVYVAAEPPAGATYSTADGRSPFGLDKPAPQTTAAREALVCRRVIVTETRGRLLRGEAFFSDGALVPFGYNGERITLILDDETQRAGYLAAMEPKRAELDAANAVDPASLF